MNKVMIIPTVFARDKKGFEARLENALDDEVEAALAQIAEIARLRLDALGVQA